MTEAGSRREFCGNLLLIASGSTLSQTPASEESVDALVERFQISAADSVLLYLDMLRKAQTEVLADSARRWSDARAPVTEGLKQISEIAERLATLVGVRVSASGVTPDYGLMPTYVEAGGPSMSDVYAFLNSIESWTSAAAQQSPQLSPDAARLLESLVREIRRVRGLNVQSNAAGVRHNEAFEQTEVVVATVRDMLIEASGIIARSQTPSARPSVEGADRIRRAAKELQQLFEIGRRGPTGEALTQILEGAALWAAGKVPTSLKQDITLASWNPLADKNSAAQPARLVKLLDDHCPVGTPWRVAGLLLLVIPI